jgi:hypothetical protein
MRIDIPDLIAIDSGILKGQFHATNGPLAFFRRGRNVVCIAVHPVPNDLAVHSDPTPKSMFQLLNHYDPRAFAQHKSISVLVEGAARLRRLIIPERQCLGRCKSRDTQWSDRRFGTTGHHDIGITSLNQAVRISNAMIARGASRHRTRVRPLGSDPNRHLPGRQIDDGHGNEKR